MAHFSSRCLKGYIYSSCYFHHQIESIHLSHCYHIFPWLCAWDVCYIIFCHLLHILSGKTGNLFSLLLCSLWSVQIFGCVWLADRTRLSVQYTISLSSLCKLIWRHWTYKMPVRYILSSVWVRLSIFFRYPLNNMMWGCVFSVYPFLLWWLRAYILSYYHHQIGNMNCYPLFRVRSWNNGVRCVSFYILTDNFHSQYGYVTSCPITIGMESFIRA